MALEETRDFYETILSKLTICMVSSEEQQHSLKNSFILYSYVL